MVSHKIGSAIGGLRSPVTGTPGSKAVQLTLVGKNSTDQQGSY